MRSKPMFFFSFLGHALPFCARPVLCWLRIPLGPCPWLHRFRGGSIRVDSPVHSTTAGSDFSRSASSATAPTLPDAALGGHKCPIAFRNVRPPRFRVFLLCRDCSSTHGESVQVPSIAGTAHVAFRRCLTGSASARVLWHFAAQGHTPHTRLSLTHPQ